MENLQTVKTVAGSNPFLTMLLFSMVIATLIASGSYVSKLKSSARALEAGLNNPPTLASTVHY